MSYPASPSHEILKLLSEILDTLIESLEPGDSTKDLDENLKILEDKFRSMPNVQVMNGTSSSKRNMDLTTLIELYQLATLVYLTRISESRLGFLGQPRDVTPLLDRACSLLDQIHTCERQFPLLILAYEALTDERRMDILDLVDRTQKHTHVRSMDFFQRGLKCLWVQKDLHADQELKLDHTQLLRVVFSCSSTLPNLA